MNPHVGFLFRCVVWTVVHNHFQVGWCIYAGGSQVVIKNIFCIKLWKMNLRALHLWELWCGSLKTPTKKFLKACPARASNILWFNLVIFVSAQADSDLFSKRKPVPQFPDSGCLWAELDSQVTLGICPDAEVSCVYWELAEFMPLTLLQLHFLNLSLLHYNEIPLK